MLREDYLRYAAAVHVDGTRFLRDTVAAMLPCYTMSESKAAFRSACTLARCETLMAKAIGLSVGLMENSGLTKYTSVIEARMRLMDVELDNSLTQRQITAARAATVPPGTRGDVYDGFVTLSSEAAEVAEMCVSETEENISAIRENRSAFSVPLCALFFLKRLCSDYATLCKKLAAGEKAEFLKRGDEFEKCLELLGYAVAAQAQDTVGASADKLAALASSGLIPSYPPIIFDILLRYENLPLSAVETR